VIRRPYRIEGIGSEYSDLLEEAGVDTVAELAQRVPANLAAKLAEINAKKKLVRRVPGEVTVTEWVKQAKKLPRLVEY
jgi:predicted flap endonuclease-1-like 5' DNA nuclease